MSRRRFGQLREAEMFAKGAHAGQKYGKMPYTYHLAAVCQVTKEFSQSLPVQIAAWLHDTIEDTAVVYNDIKMIFGEDVAELVYAVTDELGRNRFERKEKTLKKCRQTGKEAVALKLCDRIANMRFSQKDDRGHYQMYLKEAQFFHDMLHNPVDKLDDLWDELDYHSTNLDGPAKKLPGQVEA